MAIFPSRCSTASSFTLMRCIVPFFGSLLACQSAPAEPAATPKKESSPPAQEALKPAPEKATPPPVAAPTGSPNRSGDPLEGNFSLEDATKGLTGNGPLTATITTDMGALSCKLLGDKAPIAVANFVGLARGVRPWKDSTGGWVKKPAYDGTTFHRVIEGFMIQGGDPAGTGAGEPGYVFRDELWAGAKHDKAGLLCMANRGPNTNGAQFFITDDAAPHLDTSYTIFGECGPVDLVHKMAKVEVNGERPKVPLTIKSIKITKAAK